MFRSITALLLCTCFGYLASGCANFVETRTIERFTQALAEEDFQRLRESTSPEFEQKALRMTEALNDFKIVNLPEGEVSVVDVEETSPESKRVTVEVGESKHRLRYDLSLDPQTDSWVVDDIVVTQSKKGLSAAQSVAKQMDLLLTVREFLDAWSTGTRDEVLDATTPELKQMLSTLPPTYLARLTKQSLGDHSKAVERRPKAQMDEDFAHVELSRATGKLLISFSLIDGQWKVDNVIVESKKRFDKVTSVRSMAAVVNTAAAFLAAYHAEQKDALAELSTEPFYRGSLAPAKLSMVSLPDPNLPEDNQRIEIQANRADFIIEEPSRIWKISLKSNVNSADEAASRYLVEDLSVYELDGSGQEKRLSAMFTANAQVEFFAHALTGRDLNSLRLAATPDFNQRIWEHPMLNHLTVTELPMPHIEAAPPQIIETQFQGAVTEVKVLQGSQELTYVLLDHLGRLLVDDVKISAPGWTDSLKESLELIIPVQSFAASHRSTQLKQFLAVDSDYGRSQGDEFVGPFETLQRVSSRDFNRLVWHQSHGIPNLNIDVLRFMDVPISAMQTRDDQALIEFGDDRWGAKFILEKERVYQIVNDLPVDYYRYTVNDVYLIGGPEPSQRVWLKKRYRDYLSGKDAPKTIHPHEQPALNYGNVQESTDVSVPLPADPGLAFD